MSSAKPSQDQKEPSFLSQAWGTTWRKALVSLPRLVPDAALRYTSPGGPYPVVCKIPSRGKHQIPLYIFIPPSITEPNSSTNSTSRNSQNKSISLPVLLDFHGGGFVLGSCQEQAPFCAKLCRDLNCIAISVDYRLGPYAQFPAAIEDAEDVLFAILDSTKPGYNELRKAINTSLLKSIKTVQKSDKASTQTPKNPPSPQPILGIDHTRIALSGFSSGGSLIVNLALSVPPTQPHLTHAWLSALSQSQHHPPTTPHRIPLLLFYPALDTRLLPHERPLPPGVDPPSGFFASLNLEASLIPTYLPRHMTTHPRASPCLAPLSSSSSSSLISTSSSPNEAIGLHPSANLLFVLPEHDPISTQTETWIERVKEEGRFADLQVLRVKGMGHGWTQFPDQWLEADAKRKKTEAFEAAVQFVKETWEGGVGADSS